MARRRRTPVALFGPAEFEVLRAVWHLGEATARDVHDLLSEDRRVAYTTVMTTARALVRKGVLRSTRDGAAYRYVPACPPTDVRRRVFASIAVALYGDVGGVRRAAVEAADLLGTRLAPPLPCRPPRRGRSR